jgi:hypothetical protein
MQQKSYIRTLSTALIALEYSLADFNFAETRRYNDSETDLLDELVSMLAEANRALADALNAVGRAPLKEPHKSDSEH